MKPELAMHSPHKPVCLLPRAFLMALACTTFFTATGADPKPDEPLKLPSAEAFTKLRMAYAQRKDFNPMWKIDDRRDAILLAYQAKETAKAAELSKAWLAEVPVDADIHFVRAQALKKLGDWAGSFYHWHCFYGLIHSITASGDGKTPKTAFKVISVAEEYYVLDEIGAELIQQSLVESCDEMKVKLRDGSEQTLYFDVSISLAAMARQLQPAKDAK